MMGIYRWTMFNKLAFAVVGEFDSNTLIKHTEKNELISRDTINYACELIDSGFEWVLSEKYRSFKDISKEVPFVISTGQFITYRPTKDSEYKLAKIVGFMDDAVLIKLDTESKQRAIPWKFVCSIGIPSDYIKHS